MAFIFAMREGLSAAQSDLLWGVLSVVSGFRCDPLARLVDDDLAQAAAALAATLETADRGVIYEHRPDSLLAQRLLTDLKALLSQAAASADGAVAHNLDRDAAVVLRHLERAAREAGKLVDEGRASALDMITRVVRAAGRPDDERRVQAGADPSGSLLVCP